VTSQDSVEETVQAMGTHLQHSTTQMQALENLTASTRADTQALRGPARRCIVRLGGVQNVLAAMQTHAEVSGVQTEAIKVLWNLMVKSDDNTRAIVQAGGIGAIVAAMNLHVSCAALQVQGCIAFRNMAWNNAERQQAVVDVGGLEAVLTAMNVHPDESEVQLQASAAILNICNSKCPSAVTEAVSHDVLLVLQRALERHASSLDLVRKVCGALQAFFQSQDTASKGVQSGFIPLIVAAMRQHPDDAKVQRHGCVLLFLLAAENALQVCRFDGQVVATSAMQRHPGPAESDVQKHGRALLDRLTRSGRQ